MTIISHTGNHVYHLYSTRVSIEYNLFMKRQHRNQKHTQDFLVAWGEVDGEWLTRAKSKGHFCASDDCT